MIQVQKGINNSYLINDISNESHSIDIANQYSLTLKEKIIIISDSYEKLNISFDKYSIQFIFIINTDNKRVNSKYIKYFTNELELINYLKKLELQNKIYLLKGKDFKQIQIFLEKQNRQTYCEINLRKVKQNIQNLKKSLRATTSLIGMVKANAYGLGSFEYSLFTKSIF